LFLPILASRAAVGGAFYRPAPRFLRHSYGFRLAGIASSACWT